MMNLRKIPEKLVIWYYILLLKSLFLIWPDRALQKAFQLFASPRIYRVRPHEQKILEEAKRNHLQFEGNNIVTYHWGQGDKKALLMHGWEGHAGNMGAFVEPLVNAGFEVIAFDGPAHGRSSGELTNLFQFASLTEYFLKNNNIQVIVSHSFGSSAAVLALYRQNNIRLQHLFMVTALNSLIEAFEDFSRFMHFSEKEHRKLLAYVEDVFDHRVDSLETGTLASQINVDQMTLFHSPSDKLIDVRHAYELAEKIPGLNLYTPEDLGHYRILWNEDVIQTFSHLLPKNPD